MDLEDFFPDERLTTPSPDVKLICDHCAIQAACLTWAIETKQIGVWGGTTTIQRRKISRRVTRIHCPGCKSTMITMYDLLDTAVCTSCGISWPV